MTRLSAGAARIVMASRPNRSPRFCCGLKGYRILARRFVVSGGEIDLIAQRGGAIAFVEVKARADMEIAEISISAIKRRRIARAARVWLARNPWAASLALRGDAVFVAPGRLPRHAPSAYRLEID